MIKKTPVSIVNQDGRPLDVFIAGDDAQAKTRVSTFIESLGLRPMDTGQLPKSAGNGERRPAAAGPGRPHGKAHQLRPRRQHSQLSAPTLKRTLTCAF